MTFADLVDELVCALAGVDVGKRRRLNFVQGANVTIQLVDDPSNEQIDVTIASSGGGGGGAPTDAEYVVLAAHASLSAEAVLGTGVIMAGTLAARPAASRAGRLYFVTDAGDERWTRDTGAGWEDRGPDWDYVTGKPASFPPALHESSHESGQSDALTGLLDANARVEVELAGVDVGTRRTLNFIEGSGIDLTIADDAGNEEVDITIAATGGGGGVSPISICFLASGPTSWTNMPAAITEFGGNPNMQRVIHDLTVFTDCRLSVGLRTVGAAGADLILQYSTDQSSWTTIASVAIDAGGGSLVVGAWTALPVGAQADVYLRLAGQDGNGTADPQFNVITADFR